MELWLAMLFLAAKSCLAHGKRLRSKLTLPENRRGSRMLQDQRLAKLGKSIRQLCSFQLHI